MSKNKQRHKYDSTLSRTEAASLMGILLPRLKTLIKSGSIKAVEVNDYRYKRIPIQEVITILAKELHVVGMRQKSLRTSLRGLQIRFEGAIADQFAPELEIDRLLNKINATEG